MHRLSHTRQKYLVGVYEGVEDPRAPVDAVPVDLAGGRVTFGVEAMKHLDSVRQRRPPRRHRARLQPVAHRPFTRTTPECR